jgi:hypothetical protein
MATGADYTVPAGKPLAGVKVRVPAAVDPADVPQAFKDFADSLPAGGVIVAATAPAPVPADGGQWFDSTGGGLYVAFGGAWVEVGGGKARVHIGAAPPTAADGADGDYWAVYTP